MIIRFIERLSSTVAMPFYLLGVPCDVQLTVSGKQKIYGLGLTMKSHYSFYCIYRAISCQNVLTSHFSSCVATDSSNQVLLLRNWYVEKSTSLRL